MIAEADGLLNVGAFDGSFIRGREIAFLRHSPRWLMGEWRLEPEIVKSSNQSA